MVEDFLENHPEFVLESGKEFVSPEFVTPEGYVKALPFRHEGFDGAFAARMKRRD